MAESQEEYENKMEVPMPKSPIVGQDVDGLREILKYTELLECGLMACRGEPCK